MMKNVKLLEKNNLNYHVKIIFNNIFNKEYGF